ncbi:MAG TPA: glycine betaine ABC transporter substrate-binding protein, partial [Roseomonas sp.]
EFVESPAALPAFQRVYGFTLPPDRLLVLPGGDTAVTMRAAGERLNGVNAAMVYGTDGAISALSLRVLEDTKGAQIVYAPAPVVRGEVARRLPRLQEWLAPVFESLTLTRLQALNASIVVEGRPVRDVARDHLRSLGLAG